MKSSISSGVSFLPILSVFLLSSAFFIMISPLFSSDFGGYSDLIISRAIKS